MLNMSFDINNNDWYLPSPYKSTIPKYTMEYTNALWSQIFSDLNDQIYTNVEFETIEQVRDAIRSFLSVLYSFKNLMTQLKQRSLYRQTHDDLLNARNYVDILPVGLDGAKKSIRDLCNSLMEKRSQLQKRNYERNLEQLDIFAHL
jgi:hypothetical protein